MVSFSLLLLIDWKEFCLGKKVPHELYFKLRPRFSIGAIGNIKHYIIILALKQIAALGSNSDFAIFVFWKLRFKVSDACFKILPHFIRRYIAKHGTPNIIGNIDGRHTGITPVFFHLLDN